MPNRSFSVGGKYRYGFNGKEKDNDVAPDNYDFGARIYDARLGRWSSTDLFSDFYPSFSNYCFALNRPTRLIDFLGLFPGDLFNSIEEAVNDFALLYNDNSIADKREYGASIIRINFNGHTFYTYAPPNVGYSGSVRPGNPVFKKGKMVAMIHTHANWPGYTVNDFSSGDIQFQSSSLFIHRRPLYLVNPSGEIKRLNVFDKRPQDEYTLTNNSTIPHDPNDPNKKTMIPFDLPMLPKNEPTRTLKSSIFGARIKRKDLRAAVSKSKLKIASARTLKSD